MMVMWACPAGFAGRFAGYSSLVSSRALDSMLRFLRRLGVVPVAGMSVPDGPVEQLLLRFRRYLETEHRLVADSRGLPASRIRLARASSGSESGGSARAPRDVPPAGISRLGQQHVLAEV
jgi:hypothetical protein